MECRIEVVKNLEPGTVIRGDRKGPDDSKKTAWGMIARENSGSSSASGILWVEVPTDDFPTEFEWTADRRVLTCDQKIELLVDFNESRSFAGKLDTRDPDRSGLIILDDGPYFYGICHRRHEPELVLVDLNGNVQEIDNPEFARAGWFSFPNWSIGQSSDGGIKQVADSD